MSGAYYNDNDPFCAAWLRELIKANLIAPGEVDERSIEEVKPDDLRGFTQCHFFAGIGVWSYALRRSGWGDDKPVWTGSCPCPPFSSVGTKKACPQCEGTNPVPHVGRTGFFVCCLCDHEWLADGRHLWPELWRLISVERPNTFFGEQVASDDGRTWLASVRASLEILGYAVGAADLCSAGVGSADIRQRLFFVADSVRTGRAEGRTIAGRGSITGRSVSRVMGESDSAGSQPRHEASASDGYRSAAVELAHTGSVESGNGELQRGRRLLQPSENPLTGFWRDAEWIYCRDEKWRPVEPGSFPLASGITNRVGRLRGYGNAINAEVAQAFIEAYMSI